MKFSKPEHWRRSWDLSSFHSNNLRMLEERLRKNVNSSRLGFLLGLIQVPPEEFKRNAKRSRNLIARMAAFCEAPMELFKPLPNEKIAPLCLRVRSGIQKFLARKPWDTVSGVQRRLQFGFDDRPRSAYFTRDLAIAFEWAAQDLIKEEVLRVGRCIAPGCDILFMRIKASRYCSLAHSQRARSRKFYERHRAELSERRHELYKKKVAAERGDAVARRVRRQRRTAKSR